MRSSMWLKQMHRALVERNNLFNESERVSKKSRTDVTTNLLLFTVPMLRSPYFARAGKRGPEHVRTYIHTAINLAALKAMVGRKVADFLTWAVYQFEQGDVLFALLNLSLQKS